MNDLRPITFGTELTMGMSAPVGAIQHGQDVPKGNFVRISRQDMAPQWPPRTADKPRPIQGPEHLMKIRLGHALASGDLAALDRPPIMMECQVEQRSDPVVRPAGDAHSAPHSRCRFDTPRDRARHSGTPPP